MEHRRTGPQARLRHRTGAQIARRVHKAPSCTRPGRGIRASSCPLGAVDCWRADGQPTAQPCPVRRRAPAREVHDGRRPALRPGPRAWASPTSIVPAYEDVYYYLFRTPAAGQRRPFDSRPAGTQPPAPRVRPNSHRRRLCLAVAGERTRPAARRRALADRPLVPATTASTCRRATAHGLSAAARCPALGAPRTITHDPARPLDAQRPCPCRRRCARSSRPAGKR
jgi:hypothetical protein